ncbi:MAG: M23 family metallopeptidase [Gemmatimonadaceae bacterium]|nr:M23 family metallopeptidase [Gemmatimonadaceae bacterium]
MARMLCVSICLVGCNPSSALRGLRESQSAHERYGESLRAAGLDSTAIGRDWLAASDSALRSALSLTLPAREVGIYTRTEARAVAYRIMLRDGERLTVRLRAEGLTARLFLDLFQVRADSTQPFALRATAESGTDSTANPGLLSLEWEATEDGTFLLRFQPELLRSGRFELTASTGPVLAFPVEGRDNAAIQSLFGVDRDGGRRAHHGIDIFAPRGTPVVAATDGVVRSISPNGLGGNVIWLSDERRGQTLYYAHLDRHAVAAGQRVRQGDTIGFVGNTGNARTTAPHLHFGIYRRPGGAIDPLRHVRLNTTRLPQLTADTLMIGREASPRAAATIRNGPADSGASVRRLDRGTRLQVMAANGSALRIQLDDGTAGYVEASAVRVITKN